jgi:hypothetical protein
MNLKLQMIVNKSMILHETFLRNVSDYYEWSTYESSLRDEGLIVYHLREKTICPIGTYRR